MLAGSGLDSDSAFHGPPVAPRSFGPAGADENGSSGGSGSSGGGEGGGSGGSGSGGPGSGSGGAPRSAITFSLVPLPPVGGYPGGSTDYVLSFSGSSDVEDFSDYELKRETESHKIKSSVLGPLDSSVVTEAHEYYSTRDADDVTLGLPTNENPQGITGGDSTHTATSQRKSKSTTIGPFVASQTVYRNSTSPRNLDSHVQLIIDNIHVIENDTKQDYTENSHYDADGIKSGSYTDHTKQVDTIHQEDSDWHGLDILYTFGWENPPPYRLNSTTISTTITHRTGDYEADKLTETITINGVKGQPKNYTLGGSGVGEAKGPGGLVPVAPWVQHESAWWHGVADLLGSAADLVRELGKPLDRAITSGLPPLISQLLAPSALLGGSLDGLGEAATIIGREGGLTWDSAYIAGGTFALTQLGVRDILDGWEGEDTVSGEELDEITAGLRFATGTLTLGATIFGAAGYASKAVRAASSIPKTLGEVDLKGTLQGFGKNLADEGKFFGWKPGYTSKAAGDFSKEMLLQNGWTKERLSAIAEAYEHIARITPKNPSAAGRAAQLRSIIGTFFD